MISVPLTALWPCRLGGLTRVTDGDGSLRGVASAEVPNAKATVITLVRMVVLRRFTSIPPENGRLDSRLVRTWTSTQDTPMNSALQPSIGSASAITEERDA